MKRIFIYTLSVSIIFLLTHSSKAQHRNQIEVSYNPVPMLVMPTIEEEYGNVKQFNISLEMGKSYVQLRSVPYKYPICVIFDSFEMENSSGISLKFGEKIYYGIRSTYHLKGEYSLQYLGFMKLNLEDKDCIGILIGERVGYKFLIANLIAIEPFFDFGAGILTKTSPVYHMQFGSNLGIRF
ncbi:MAG: hypothetical protein H8E14_13010 [Candidatus Marinimicrobia bacterium]|nr:hypothetical protein [Candidatus Neomarinimicrobiota bacterium]